MEGILLLLLPTAVVTGTVFSLVKGELKEDPTDLVRTRSFTTPGRLFSREFPQVFPDRGWRDEALVKLVLVVGPRTTAAR